MLKLFLFFFSTKTRKINEQKRKCNSYNLNSIKRIWALYGQHNHAKYGKTHCAYRRRYSIDIRYLPIQHTKIQYALYAYREKAQELSPDLPFSFACRIQNKTKNKIEKNCICFGIDNHLNSVGSKTQCGTQTSSTAKRKKNDVDFVSFFCIVGVVLVLFPLLFEKFHNFFFFCCVV